MYFLISVIKQCKHVSTVQGAGQAGNVAAMTCMHEIANMLGGTGSPEEQRGPLIVLVGKVSRLATAPCFQGLSKRKSIIASDGEEVIQCEGGAERFIRRPQRCAPSPANERPKV